MFSRKEIAGTSKAFTVGSFLHTGDITKKSIGIIVNNIRRTEVPLGENMYDRRPNYWNIVDTPGLTIAFIKNSTRRFSIFDLRSYVIPNVKPATKFGNIVLLGGNGLTHFGGIDKDFRSSLDSSYRGYELLHYSIEAGTIDARYIQADKITDLSDAFARLDMKALKLKHDAFEQVSSTVSMFDGARVRDGLELAQQFSIVTDATYMFRDAEMPFLHFPNAKFAWAHRLQNWFRDCTIGSIIFGNASFSSVGKEGKTKRLSAGRLKMFEGADIGTLKASNDALLQLGLVAGMVHENIVEVAEV